MIGPDICFRRRPLKKDVSEPSSCRTLCPRGLLNVQLVPAIDPSSTTRVVRAGVESPGTGGTRITRAEFPQTSTFTRRRQLIPLGDAPRGGGAGAASGLRAWRVCARSEGPRVIFLVLRLLRPPGAQPERLGQHRGHQEPPPSGSTPEQHKPRPGPSRGRSLARSPGTTVHGSAGLAIWR